MKMIEITMNKEVKELEKLNEKLERAKKTYEKKLEIAKKYGVDTWGIKEHNEWLDTIEKTDGFRIANKSDIKKNGAWFDLSIAEDRVVEIEKAIERCEKRLEHAELKVEEYRAEVTKIEDAKKREAMWQEEFEQEQKAWAKDGITLEARYRGLTPSGKHFWIERNHGWSFRSLHCFTLTIDGETIFTSGEFWRCYMEIKRR